jgi:hypothetical protein
VSLDVVAGDGTKLKANAAMAGNLTREQLDAQVSELEAWIGAELRQWAAGFLGPGEDPATVTPAIYAGKSFVITSPGPPTAGECRPRPVLPPSPRPRWCRGAADPMF